MWNFTNNNMNGMNQENIHINFGGYGNNQTTHEVTKICTNHPGCVDCPLKDGTLDIGGSAVTCYTKEFRERN